MSDLIAQLNDALAGRYAIAHEIGAGGMATVYLARDLRHDRRVALKVLKAELGAVLGGERFLGEIRVTANLQHPHLLPLFDSGEAAGQLFYVMPFVEGETLRHRLERERQLPVEEALRLAMAIAGALAYAHERGVIHRDLKPENILLQAGQPLVADFGIALAVTNAGGARVTQTGLSLGTPQYMSPEQAAGDRQLDARSDVYALGAITYEMLVGEPPHTGATVQAIIARVLTDRPRSVRESRDTVPPSVDAALRKALAKLPADRFATAAQFAEALNTTSPTLPAGEATDARPAPRWTRWIPWGIAAVAVAVAAGTLALGRREAVVDSPALLAELPPPMQDADGVRNSAAALAVSRDGHRLAVQALATGRMATFVRRTDEEQFRELPVQAIRGGLAFSPDGSALVLASRGSIQRIGFDGSGLTTLAAISDVVLGLAWDDGDRIVVATDKALLAVPANGGVATRLAALDTSASSGTDRDGSEITGYASPGVLPGNAGVLVQRGTARGDDIILVRPDGTTRPVGIEGQSPRYVASGHLVVRRGDGTLFAYPFDPQSGKAGGPGIPLLARTALGLGSGVYDLSWSGLLLASRGVESEARVVEVSRAGVVTPLPVAPQQFRMPRVSPNGQRVLLETAEQGRNLAILDRRTGTLTPFTTGGGYSDPLWGPDGRTVYFRKLDPVTDADIWRQDAERTRPMEPVLQAPWSQYPWAVSGDERRLIYDEVGGTAVRAVVRIMEAEVGRPTSARPLVSTEFMNTTAALSPDRQWLAYQSTESGRSEVFIQPYPGTGGRVKISTEGGGQPRWSSDGRELFYRDGTAMQAVRLQLGPGVAVIGRTALFADRFAFSNATNYDVLPGNGGFLMLEPVRPAAHISVITNIGTLLRARAGR